MRERFEKLCVHSIFILGTILIFQLGIQAAGAIMDFGRARKIEAIDLVIQQLAEGPSREKAEQTQEITVKYLGAYLKAMLRFEFVPRNDLDTLTSLIASTPPSVKIQSMEYSGRDLSISTIQSQYRDAEAMAKSLERNGAYANVVFYCFVNNDGQLEGQITCYAHHYEQISLRDGLSEFFETIRNIGEGTANGTE